MSFSIQKKKFFDVIQKAIPLIPSKTSLQILLNLKLTFNNSVLEVAATDLDHSITIKTDITGDGQFEITVNAKKLFEIVRELYDDELIISIEENVLTLQSGGAFTCRIAGADSRDYPRLPAIENYKEYSIDAVMFKEMMNKASFAVSRDEARACLCGVLWEVERSHTAMVSTDGHRLGCSANTVDFDIDDGNKITSIISPKTINLLDKIIDTETEGAKLTILSSDKYLVVKNDVFYVCTKMIEGPYPDYEKVIPKNNPRKILVSRGMLLDAVRRVSVLSNAKTHLVKYRFLTNQLELMVLNRDISSEARQILPVDYSGEEFVIGFDASYFTEILTLIKTPNVLLEMNTQISACLVHPVYEDEGSNRSIDTYLIMPLRIIEEM